MNLSLNAKKILAVLVLSGMIGTGIFYLLSRRKHFIPQRFLVERRTLNSGSSFTTLIYEINSDQESLNKQLVDKIITFINEYLNDVCTNYELNIREEIENSIQESCPDSLEKNARIKCYPIWDTTAKCTLWVQYPYPQNGDGWKMAERIILIDSRRYKDIKDALEKARKKQKKKFALLNTSS